MAPFSEEETQVARHYNEAAFDAELVRLPQDCPVELAVTRRWLGRVAKAGDLAAEIGVGGGHYTEFLARLGCRLHLVEETGQTPEGIGQSDHFLFVGRKL